MRRDRKYVKATILEVDGVLFADIDKKDLPRLTPSTRFKVLNSVDEFLSEGMVVLGYLIMVNKKKRSFMFYITSKNNPSISITDVRDLIIEVVTKTLNKEPLLYGKPKEEVLPEHVIGRSRKREITLCRHMSVIHALDILSNRCNISNVLKLFGLNRANLYNIEETIEGLSKSYKQINRMMTSIKNELREIMTNINNFNNFKEEKKNV